MADYPCREGLFTTITQFSSLTPVFFAATSPQEVMRPIFMFLGGGYYSIVDECSASILLARQKFLL
ncbi:MAG: hypothetical protein HC941_13425 [Microcoleus sp. SU_5_3]|nr:hypothetical protein [Microcoleus sp. SU_5_3]